MTVTDRDAKALGQPVGSTTTVLLTAYPGGHNGAAGAGGVAGTGGNPPTGSGGGVTATGGEPPTVSTSDASNHQQFLTSIQQPSSSTTAGNVQVVYSASHVEPIPGTISSDVTNPPNLSDFTSVSSTQMGEVSDESGGGTGMTGMVPPPQSVDPHVVGGGAVAIGVNDYLNPNPPSSQEAMLAAAAAQQHNQSSTGAGGMGETDDASSDLAAELIREYSLGGGATVGDVMGRKEANQLATPTLPTAGGGAEGEVKDSKSPES